ncbi:DUF3108 domain-containing protein [uncultured Ramlibacter sp.]|uniref:DUF3108 domain-containing protein n=1 Tax=uncultured Ramlibacter sp. TaxID=260755 RepID=UPI00263131C8|nr:DUF3108 domain-containing protein [uncultured Ramlibacter sp.]
MNSGLRWRPFAALTAAVTAAHLLVLRAVPDALRPADAPVLRLVTRSIEAPAPPSIAVPEEKRPVAPVKRALAATKSIASGASPPAAATPQEAPATPVPVAADALPPPEAAAPAAGAAPLRERTAPASVFAVPGSVQLRYAVTAQARGGLWQGKALLVWRHDGSQYDSRLEISTLLLPTRVQRSTGRIDASGLAPLRFSDKARSEEAAHFERDRGRIVFSSNRPEAPLLAGAQDRLSVMLQLGAMLAGEPAKYPVATTIEIQTAGTRDAELWLFTVQESEELQLPGGPLAAVKLLRNPRKEFDQTVELWLAPAMDYVPVRLRLTQANGDWLDLQWSATDRF